MEGLTLPVDNQVVFGQIMGRFIQRGESKDITLYLEGKVKLIDDDLNFGCEECDMRINLESN